MDGCGEAAASGLQPRGTGVIAGPTGNVVVAASGLSHFERDEEADSDL
jgi:hypothetical protein